MDAPRTCPDCEAARFTVLDCQIKVDELDRLMDAEFANSRIVQRRREKDGAVRCTFADGSWLLLNKFTHRNGVNILACRNDGRRMGVFEASNEYAVNFFLEGRDDWLR